MLDTNKNNSKPTSIRLDVDILNKVIEDAQKEKRSISKQIEYMLQQYYEMKQLLR